MFELAENRFRKSFSVKPTCLAITENRISRNPFQFDQNLPHLTQKSFYRIILPSNCFRVTRKRERKREKERERDSTEKSSHQHPAPVKARSIQELRRTQHPAPAMPQSSDREPIPQIVELVHRTHSSDREPRSSPRDHPAESPICLL